MQFRLIQPKHLSPILHGKAHMTSRFDFSSVLVFRVLLCFTELLCQTWTGPCSLLPPTPEQEPPGLQLDPLSMKLYLAQTRKYTQWWLGAKMLFVFFLFGQNFHIFVDSPLWCNFLDSPRLLNGMSTWNVWR